MLVPLGFAGTDFAITMTLSAADSAQHVVENPLLKSYVGHLHLAITMGLLVRAKVEKYYKTDGPDHICIRRFAR